MQKRMVYLNAVARIGLDCRRVFDVSAGRTRGSVIGLGLVSALVALGSRVAQAQDEGPETHGLTVRPGQMATGTQNPPAGEYRLNSLPALLTVPPQCVGARRCPLVLVFPSSNTARVSTEWHRPMAENYGMLLLVPAEWDTRSIDAGLQEALQKFAIDPDKIAAVGRCASGSAAWLLGGNNPAVFSRIALISANLPFPPRTMNPQNTTVQLFVEAGLLEPGTLREALDGAQDLRVEGHPVTFVVGLRAHEHQLEDYDFLGHWLQESWATPNPAARPVPKAVADPLPLLTTEVLTQMTSFWTRFAQQPESIRTVARRRHLRELQVSVGTERPLVWLTDLAALAAQYPSVAADLQQAGLTAQQHDAYRVALISTRIAAIAKDLLGPLEATSVLAKNLAFYEAHPDELEALEKAGQSERSDEAFAGGGSKSIYPNAVDAAGSIGMWGTP